MNARIQLVRRIEPASLDALTDHTRPRRIYRKRTPVGRCATTVRFSTSSRPNDGECAALGDVPMSKPTVAPPRPSLAH